MNRYLPGLFVSAPVLALGLVFVLLFSTPLFGQSCDAGSFPELPDVTISEVSVENAPVPHCKVAGLIGPEIHFELLLPETWNGKFVMGGGGGFVGSVQNMALYYGALQSGYATVGTDTGHQANGVDASWALNNLERIVNFGHQAVHRTAVTAKALTSAYYETDIKRNYFIGCSRGGGQALMSAQRYPHDFEGIVAGAPAYNWPGLGAQAIQVQQRMFPDPGDLQQAVFRQSDQELLEAAILNQCDAADGIEDGILNDPRQCDFDVTSLLCEREGLQGCLSDARLKAAQSIYDGPKDQHGDLFYGFPFGGESDDEGWSRWLTGGLALDKKPLSDGRALPEIPNMHYGFGNGVLKYFVYQDANWDYSTYDFSTFREDSMAVGATLNATDPDLSTFRDRGGKLLMYQGWSDTAISALATIGYYEEVLAQDKTAKSYTRLFMMPGVLHCAGGKGPSAANFLNELDQWVESGEAPEQVTAYFMGEDRKPTGSRPLCPYPQRAEYDGHGNPRKIESFSCSAGE